MYLTAEIGLPVDRPKYAFKSRTRRRSNAPRRRHVGFDVRALYIWLALHVHTECRSEQG